MIREIQTDAERMQFLLILVNMVFTRRRAKQPPAEYPIETTREGRH